MKTTHFLCVILTFQTDFAASTVTQVCKESWSQFNYNLSTLMKESVCNTGVNLESTWYTDDGFKRIAQIEGGQERVEDDG